MTTKTWNGPRMLWEGTLPSNPYVAIRARIVLVQPSRYVFEMYHGLDAMEKESWVVCHDPSLQNAMLRRYMETAEGLQS